MPIKRGEIYYVDLDPTVGREIRKRRPSLVISIDDINSKPLVVTIIPGTSAHDERAFRNVVTLQPDARNGLGKPTSFLCHQMRAVDHTRFAPRPIGRITAEDLMRIEGATKYSLGLL